VRARTPDIPATEIRSQLEKISTGPELENSPRLVELLNYIGAESLAGRADRIKGFSIGQAIYAADLNFDPESNSIVRVEMGRLRRRLAEYYLSSGRTDPIVVDIPKGSYAPQFTLNPQASEEIKPARPEPGKTSVFNNRWLLAGALGLAILLALNWRYEDSLEPSAAGGTNQDNTQNYSQDSEAKILFRQAFALLMPPEDGSRLIASRNLFQRVIELDSGLAQGYAGKSITFSFGVIFLKSASPADDLRQALTLAESAVGLDPEYAMGFAALAFAQALAEDYAGALTSVRRVLAIRPHQASSNAIASIALIVSGEPSRAIELLTEAMRLNPDDPRTPLLNILGVAQYINGDFSGAAASIEKNLARRGPGGPHMDVFLAAAYAQMGKNFEAQAVIEKIQRTNPDYPVKNWLGHFIKPENELQAIMTKLELLGLRGNDLVTG
jgi:tetratricopeptide (TPR) repeat protein